MLLTTEHIFPVGEGPHPWASLHVMSRASDASHLPIFLSDDAIKGTVVLDLESDKQINRISVEIKGHVHGALDAMKNTSAVDEDNAEQLFLSLEEILWPQEPHTTQDTPLRFAKEGTNQKLQGRHEWSYVMKLPESVKFSRIDSATSYALPPHYNPPLAAMFVVYEISLKINTGGMFFKNQSTISRQFGVVPNRHPPPPSPACELALHEAKFPPGPQVDSDGWNVLPSSVCSGILTDGTEVDVTCFLAMNKPLIYARGHPILLQIILESSSEHALDTIVKYNAPQVCFVRVSTRGVNHTQLKNAKAERDWWHRISCVTMGICWTPSDEAQTGNRRVLNCEVRLKQDLSPSFELYRVKLEYFIAILPFKTVEFTPKTEQPLMMQKVDIVGLGPSRIPGSLAPAGATEPPFPDYEGWSTGKIDRWNELTRSGFLSYYG